MEKVDSNLPIPAIDSAIAEERISARRFRIEKRLEDAERLAQGDDQQEEEIPELSVSENQIMKSDKFLSKIIEDSSTLVQNVKKAAELDEIRRKQHNREYDLKLKEKLDFAEKSAEEQFQEISRKWQETVEGSVPSDLYEKLMSQKHACDAVIAEKDQLIRELKQEIAQKALVYGNNVEREEEEVQMTVDRAREQIKLLSRSYNKEINKIEDSLINEWRELFESQMKEWMNTLINFGTKDDERLKINREMYEKCEQELDEIRRLKADEYTRLRTELDTDAQILEQYLQQMKAHLQLNQEKLEYGYQVLRKREDEQAVVKAQQKRKVTKLQDTLTNLKKRIEKREILHREQQLQLQDDCLKTGLQIQDLYKKLRHFRSVDDQKFKELWRMNDATARELTGQLTKIDQEIHERILNLPWRQPELFFEMDDISKTGTSKKMASLSAPLRRKPRSPYWLFGVGLMTVRSRSTPVRKAHTKNEMVITPEIRKTLLLALANEAAFLVEKRTEKFTTVLPDREQALIKLDGIFQALNIERTEEIEPLILLLYKRCYEKASLTETEVDIDRSKLSVKLPPLARSEGTVNHDAILKAVDEFLETRSKTISIRRKLRKPNSDEVEETLDENEIAAYWERYLRVLPESRHQLWDTLAKGLEKLRCVEVERTRLELDNVDLHNQNVELKQMLSQYLRSRALG